MIEAIKKLPRVQLGFYPTPMTDAKRLSAELGGPRIFIKRDDLSGLAIGGNKARKLEFILAEAKQQGATAVVSTASAQSNFCLQMAAAARKLNMRSSFALLKGVHNEVQGNLLLQNILESDIEILEVADMTLLQGSFISDKLDAVADKLRAEGETPYIVKHTLPEIPAILGVVGWITAADELNQQFAHLGIDPDYVVLVNGGGGTQAGLEIGARHLNTRWKVVGIPVLNKTPVARKVVADQANAASDYLGLNITVNADEVEVHDEYIGEGYGIPTTEGINAIRLMAQTEAIFLCPVYTGKGLSGVVDLIKKERFKSSDTIVFVHTGGIPALFAYQPEVVK